MYDVRVESNTFYTVTAVPGFLSVNKDVPEHAFKDFPNTVLFFEEALFSLKISQLELIFGLIRDRRGIAYPNLEKAREEYFDRPLYGTPSAKGLSLTAHREVEPSELYSMTSQGTSLEELRFAWILLLAGLAIATLSFVLTEETPILTKG